MPISTSLLGLSKSQTVFGMLCIFADLLFLNLQEWPGAEEDLLVPPELDNPAIFCEGVRNAGLEDIDLFDSLFRARLWSNSLAVETAAERTRLQFLWTKFSSSLSLTQRLILSWSAILRGIYSRVIRDILSFIQTLPAETGQLVPNLLTRILSCWSL